MHSPGGGWWWGFALKKAFIFKHPVNQLTENYLKRLKTKNFMNEGCLYHWGQFSYKSQKSHTFPAGRESLELGQAHKKLLACSASEGTSQHLNKVSRENSCAWFLFFSIFTSFSFEDRLGSQLAYFVKQLI